MLLGGNEDRESPGPGPGVSLGAAFLTECHHDGTSICRRSLSLRLRRHQIPSDTSGMLQAAPPLQHSLRRKFREKVIGTKPLCVSNSKFKFKFEFEF